MHRNTIKLAIRDIDPAEIDPSPFKARHYIDPDAIEVLATSIRDVGQIHPIVVRPSGTARYQLVTGALRLAAAKRANCNLVSALIVTIDDSALRRIAIAENSARFNLTPMDEARLIDDLLGVHGKAGTSEIIGRSVRSVEMARARMYLPGVIRTGLTRAGLSGRHATALLRLQPWPEVQSAVFSHIMKYHIPVAACEPGVRRILSVLRSSEVVALPGVLARIGVETLEQVFERCDAPASTPIVESHAYTLARDLRRLLAEKKRIAPRSRLSHTLSEIRALSDNLCRPEAPLEPISDPRDETGCASDLGGETPLPRVDLKANPT